jgi:hypothetical protein
MGPTHRVPYELAMRFDLDHALIDSIWQAGPVLVGALWIYGGIAGVLAALGWIIAGFRSPRARPE